MPLNFALIRSCVKRFADLILQILFDDVSLDTMVSSRFHYEVLLVSKNQISINQENYCSSTRVSPWVNC